MVRTFLLNAAAGVERVYWYAWDNRNWVRLQLMDSHTGTTTRAGLAYAELYHRLTGTQVEECRAQSSSWFCRIAQADGRRWQVVWNDATTVHRKVEFGKEYFPYFPCADGSVVRSGEVAIGGCPLALKQSR